MTATSTRHEKLSRLHQQLASLGSVAIAYSGGVDSTFLLHAAHTVFGDDAFAVMAATDLVPSRDRNDAEAFCETHGIQLEMVPLDVLDVPEIAANPPERCYLCKKHLFGALLNVAKQNGARCLCEGSNIDDEHDYRPGFKAVKELGITSPLLEAKMNKLDIRELSRELGLPTWDKPSAACLASRIPYTQPITRDKLTRIDAAENALRDSGFATVRVRLNGNSARIEVEREDIARLASPETRESITKCLKELGFGYISLDLEGYRTGSLNESLNDIRKP